MQPQLQLHQCRGDLLTLISWSQLRLQTAIYNYVELTKNKYIIFLFTLNKVLFVSCHQTLLHGRINNVKVYSHIAEKAKQHVTYNIIYWICICFRKKTNTTFYYLIFFLLRCLYFKNILTEIN